MSKLAVFDMKGSSVGEAEFSDDLLVTKGNQAVQDKIVAELAALRAGTASTLRKGLVAGSNKKPWQQKGTGRARAGVRQSPVWRGGGVAFGPHPRDYSKQVNRKVSRLAFQRAFSDKVSSGNLKIVDELKLAEPKTAAFSAMLKALKISGPALFLGESIDGNVELAARNIPRIMVARANEVGVYQLVKAHTVILDRAGLEVVRKRLEGKLHTTASSEAATAAAD